MKRRTSGLVCFALCALSALPAWAGGVPEGFGDLAAKVTPAVVNVAAAVAPAAGGDNMGFDLPPGPFGDFLKKYLEPFEDDPSELGQRPRTVVSLGSGFLVDRSGYIVTNHHVVQNARRIQITLADGRKFDARPVGHDEETDLALLKIEAEEDLPHTTWGDSQSARVGDWVLAVGNPFGFGGTVTLGIISGRGRDIQSGRFDDYLQIDASINRGNSGGPSFDWRGNVIGVNTAIYSTSGGSIGIGFAVPSAMAKPIIDELKDHGRVVRGWLGVRLQALTPEIATSLDFNSREGVVVLGSIPGSPAERVDLRSRDIITKANGSTVKDPRDLTRFIASIPPGGAVALELWRDGQSIEVVATLGQPIPEAKNVVLGSAPTYVLGLTLQSLTGKWRQRFDVREDLAGALVVAVEAGSPAEDVGLMPGDVITTVGDVAVATPDEFIEAIDLALEIGRAAALLMIERGENQRFVGLPLPKG